MRSAKAIPPDTSARIIEDGGSVRVVVAGEDLGFAFQPVRHDTLTMARALDMPREQDVIVRFRRASPDAKQLLRERRIPYASDDGEIFVLDPPVAVHQSAPRRKGPRGDVAGRGQPFATKASRVARWLLNHPSEVINLRQLAAATKLSEGAVSNTVRELHERMLVDVTRDPNDARVRLVRTPEPGRLVEAWERAWELRRLRMIEWDIGTTNVEETLRVVRQAAAFELAWAVGGLAGAARLTRAVEPADVLLWMEGDQLPQWEELLVPTPGRGRRGTLRLATAPDPFVFELSQDRDGWQVADSAQLYLDCSREGERALEAADAIRRHMGW